VSSASSFTFLPFCFLTILESGVSFSFNRRIKRRSQQPEMILKRAVEAIEMLRLLAEDSLRLKVP
jgi:hypothetical protein